MNPHQEDRVGEHISNFFLSNNMVIFWKKGGGGGGDIFSPIAGL